MSETGNQHDLKHKLREMEETEIIRALEESRWCKAKAARRLGITERMIGYKINKYGLKKEVEGRGDI